MSWLSQLKHKQITPQQFAEKTLGLIRKVIGETVTPDARNKAADDVERLKAVIQHEVDTYLVAKLGQTLGGVAGHAADNALNTVAAAIEGVVATQDHTPA